MSKRLYMHTLNGKPAKYAKEGYIHVVGQGFVGLKASSLFVGSLATIRRQRKRDRDFRAAENWSLDDFKYGYIVIGNDL